MQHTQEPQQPNTTPDEIPQQGTSRRRMLRLAATAAGAAAAVAVTANARPAAAINNPLLLGQANSDSTPTTLLGELIVLDDTSSSGSTYGDLNGAIVGWDTSNTNVGVHGGVLGLAAGTQGQAAHGVVGAMAVDLGFGAGVYGIARGTVQGRNPGVRARSDKGPALLLEATRRGAPTDGTWTAGSLVPDVDGNLWYCVADGVPGTWLNLASLGQKYHPLTPGRVFDSRGIAPIGPLAAGGTRTISVANRIDPNTFATNLTGFVPAGATAVTANVTVVDTVGSGFLALNPAGDTTVHAATVNWFAGGQILNNGVNLTLGGDRQLTIVAGGTSGSATDLVVDVTGYYL
jgi:hypothetical protein